MKLCNCEPYIFPIHSFKEGTLFYFLNSRIAPHTLLCLATKLFNSLKSVINTLHIVPPFHYRLSFRRNWNFRWKYQCLLPIHHFSVCFLGCFFKKLKGFYHKLLLYTQKNNTRAEGWVA